MCIAVKILKGFTFQYQTEAFASWRISPIIFVKNKVPYNIFSEMVQGILGTK